MNASLYYYKYMALIRKYKNGDAAEEPKKVLTRQNVGEYDSNKLAKSLTLSLYTEADKYEGSDRLSFLEFGSLLILAVKDGNVTVNTDGSISILGNYNLNNKYTDKEVQDLKDADEVGRGASPYEGEYLRSHGIFTTNKTRNFRNDNHMMGLVGRWLIDSLDRSDPIEEKETKYTFDNAFADRFLNGITDNKALWLKNNTNINNRLDSLIEVLNNADKEKLGMKDKDFTNLINEITKAKESKDYTGVRNAALSLGLNLDTYLPGYSKPKDEVSEVDKANQYWNNIAKELEAAYPYLSKQDIQLLVNEKKKEKAATMQKHYNDENDNLLAKAIEDLASSILTPIAYQNNGITLKHTFSDNLDLFRDQIISLAKYTSSWDGTKNLDQNALNIIDALIDTYGDGSDIKNLHPAIQLLYELITADNEYGKNGWVALAATKGKYYTFIFNPTTGEFRKVHNVLLKGTMGYDSYIEDFKKLWRGKHPVHLVLFKKGGIIKAYDGTKAAWLENFKKTATTSTKSNNTASENKSPEKRLFITPEELHGAFYKQEKDSNGNPIEQDFFYTNEDGWQPTTNDWVRLSGIVGDLVSLGGGWWDLGGVYSILANAYADFTDAADGKGTTSEAWNNLKNNTGLTVAGLLPTLSSLKVVKDIKAISTTSKIIPWVIGVLVADGVISNLLANVYTNAVDNIMNDKYSSQDLQELAGLGLVAMSLLLKKGSMRKGDGPLGGIRSRRVSNATEHLTVKGDSPTITTESGKKFTLTNEELQKIKDAGSSYKEQNEAFLQIQKDRRAALGYSTEIANGERAPKYENLKVGLREGHFYDKDAGMWNLGDDTRAPRTADLKERHSGKLLTTLYIDENGGIRTVEVPLGATILSEARIPTERLTKLLRLPKIELGKGTLVGFKDIPPGALKINDNTFKYKGNYYTRKNGEGDFMLHNKPSYEAPARNTSDLFVDEEASTRSIFADEEVPVIHDETPSNDVPFSKNGGILYAKIGYKLSNGIIHKIKPLSENYVEVEIPDWLEEDPNSGIYDVSKLKKVTNDNGDVIKYSDEGLIFQSGGEQFSSYDIAKLHGSDVHIVDSPYSRNGWDPNIIWLRDASFGTNSTGTNGATHAYSTVDKGLSAALLETNKYKGTNIIGYNLQDFNDWNEVLERAIKNFNSLNSNEQRAVLNFMFHENQSNYASAGDKNLYLVGDNAYTDDDMSKLTYSSLRQDAIKKFMSKRSDGAKKDANGNYVFDGDGNPKVANPNANGTGHQSMRRMQYNTLTRNFIIGDNNKLTLAGDDFDASKYESAREDSESLGVDTNYVNKYWKLKSLGNAEETKVTFNGKEYTQKDGKLYDADGNEIDLNTILTASPTKSNINYDRSFGNLSELLRTGYLNFLNRLATNEIQWSDPLKLLLHRNELLEGNYRALKEALNGVGQINSLASRTFTSDAALQKASQLDGTYRGIGTYREAAGLDSLRFFDTRHKVLDMLNQDLVYNTGAEDYGRQILSQSEKDEAALRANLIIENAKNLSNFWAGQSKQMFDAADASKQLALQHAQTEAGNKSQTAYLLYLNDHNTIKYYGALLDATRQADEAAALILKYRPYKYATVYPRYVKKGGSLTATQRYILQGSKDFNKRKLEEAREFHKNMRKKK